MKLFLYFSLIWILISNACLFAEQNRYSIAVEFEYDSSVKEKIPLFSEALEKKIYEYYKRRIICEKEINEYLQKRDFYCSSGDVFGCLIEHGKLLKVKKVVECYFVNKNGSYLVSLRVIDVDQGIILDSFSKSYKGQFKGFQEKVVPLIAKRVGKVDGKKQIPVKREKVNCLPLNSDSCRNSFPWVRKVLYCTDNPHEKFYSVKVSVEKEKVSIVFIGLDEKRISLYEYVGEEEKVHLIDSEKYKEYGEIGSAVYGYKNLKIEDNVLYFYLGKDFPSKSYKLGSKDEPSVTGIENFDDNREYNEMKFMSPKFISPDNKFIADCFGGPPVNIIFNATKKSINLKDLKDVSILGDNSIGYGTWSYDSKKFYFDNFGPLACIWELDLEKTTIKKIVPEHHAIFPQYYEFKGRSFVVYSERNCIKVATP